MTSESIREIFEKYHRFDDGLVLSFEYFYADSQPLAAQVTFYAKNHELPGNVWRKVKLTIKDVHEIRIKVKGNQFNTITSGVRLLNFDDLWCIDIDGNYEMDTDPTTLEQIRQDGECYVTGRTIEACEIIEG